MLCGRKSVGCLVEIAENVVFFGVASSPFLSKPHPEIYLILFTLFPTLSWLFVTLPLATGIAIFEFEFFQKVIDFFRELLFELYFVGTDSVNKVKSLLQKIFPLLLELLFSDEVRLLFPRFVELYLQHFVVILEGNEHQRPIHKDLEIYFDWPNQLRIIFIVEEGDFAYYLPK